MLTYVLRNYEEVVKLTLYAQQSIIRVFAVSARCQVERVSRKQPGREDLKRRWKGGKKRQLRESGSGVMERRGELALPLPFMTVKLLITVLYAGTSLL